MTPEKRARDKQMWIEARLGTGASREELAQYYDRMTSHVIPPRTERQRRVLTEKQLALQGRK